MTPIDLADDIAIRIPGSSAMAGEHRGRDVAVRYIETARIAEIFIYEADQHAVDALFAVA